MSQIPIDIVNRILEYVGDLNQSVVVTQYYPVTNKEYYKINFGSDLLWRIKSTLVMKRHYPIRAGEYWDNKGNIVLYRWGIAHYENALRLNSCKN
jgi:hypothetical protein